MKNNKEYIKCEDSTISDYKEFYKKLHYLKEYRQKMPESDKNIFYIENIKNINNFYEEKFKKICFNKENFNNFKFLIKRKGSLEYTINNLKNKINNSYSDFFIIISIILSFYTSSIIEYGWITFAIPIIILFYKHMKEAVDEYNSDNYKRALIEFELDIIETKIKKYNELFK